MINATVSVIVTCYNRDRFFKDALLSVLAQSRKADEIIFVNNSDDPIAKAEIRAGVKTFKKIKYFELEDQTRSCNARNYGARVATSDFILFLDDDDLLMPHAIEIFLKAYETQAQLNAGKLAFVYCQSRRIGDRDEIWGHFDWDFTRLITRGNYICITSLIRRDVYLQVGGVTESLDNWEDFDLWIKIGELGYVGYLVREPLFCWRFHSAQKTVTRNLDGNVGKIIDKVWKDIRALHPKLPIPEYYTEKESELKVREAEVREALK